MKKFFVLILFFILAAWFVSSCGPDKKDLKEIRENGVREFYNGKYPEAIKAFTEYLDHDSSQVEIYFYRGSAWFNMKEVNKAIADFNTAIRIKPDYADAYSTRGDIYFYLGKKEEACKDYKKAMELGKPNMRDKVRYCP